MRHNEKCARPFACCGSRSILIAKLKASTTGEYRCKIVTEPESLTGSDFCAAIFSDTFLDSFFGAE